MIIFNILFLLFLIFVMLTLKEQPPEEYVCVYVMHIPAEGICKIGISNNPHRRAQELSDGFSPVYVIFSKYFHTREDAADVEHTLHSIYDNYRIDSSIYRGLISSGHTELFDEVVIDDFKDFMNDNSDVKNNNWERQ